MLTPTLLGVRGRLNRPPWSRSPRSSPLRNLWLPRPGRRLLWLPQPRRRSLRLPRPGRRSLRLPRPGRRSLWLPPPPRSGAEEGPELHPLLRLRSRPSRRGHRPTLLTWEGTDGFLDHGGEERTRRGDLGWLRGCCGRDPGASPRWPPTYL
jgi:hypothetical protein